MSEQRGSPLWRDTRLQKLERKRQPKQVHRIEVGATAFAAPWEPNVDLLLKVPEARSKARFLARGDAMNAPQGRFDLSESEASFWR